MLIDFKHLDLELEHKSEINGCINTKNFVMAADLDQYALFLIVLLLMQIIKGLIVLKCRTYLQMWF